MESLERTGATVVSLGVPNLSVAPSIDELD
jgi:hypothetical protein